MTCKGKGARKFAPVTVFSSQAVGETRTMNARRPVNYLRLRAPDDRDQAFQLIATSHYD